LPFNRFSRPALLLRFFALTGGVFLLLPGWLFTETAVNVSAHAELLEASPPADGLLAVPPRTVQLRMSETVAEGAGSPSIEVIDQQGRAISVTDIQVDETDATRVSARITGITTGTYTLLWSVRSEVDGHTLTGSYAFRVGEGRAPGAAVVDGQSPRAWAVATRWATFVGASLAAGAILAMLLTNSLDLQVQTLVMGRLGIAGGILALIASSMEPLLITRFPPEGVTAPSLADAFTGLPSAWWLRPVGALIVITLFTFNSQLNAKRLTAPYLFVPIVIVSGLSLTSHAAARPHLSGVATIVNLIHLSSIAYWLGGLLTLTLHWRILAATLDYQRTAIHRFSRLAAVLMVIGLTTGAGNAGFVLPSIDSITASSYGKLLLGKLLVVVPVLGLAFWHRRALRDSLSRRFSRFQKSLILESALALFVIVAAASLALLSPPRAESDSPKSTTIALPVFDVASAQNLNTLLTLSPARSGDNALSVSFTNQDRTAYSGELPAKVVVTLSSLEFPARIAQIELTPNADRSFSATGATIGLDGWWHIDVALRWLGVEDLSLAYYVLLPDPNVFGLDAIKTPDSDPVAESIYAAGMANLTGLHTVRYWQSMSDNKGGVAYAEHTVNDGFDGKAAPGFIYRAPGRYEAYVIGTTGWMLENGEWEVLETGQMIPPSRWDDEYQNATGFRLGNTETIDGECCQIITFVVPPTKQQVISFYAWWVGTETGQVRRDVMVSRAHYMTNNFVEFNTDLPLDLPPDAPPDPFLSPVAATSVTTAQGD